MDSEDDASLEVQVRNLQPCLHEIFDLGSEKLSKPTPLNFC